MRHAAVLSWLAREAPAVFRAPHDAALLAALRRRRLRSLLAAAERTPLHAERAAGLAAAAAAAADPFALLEAFPPLDKAALRAAGDAALQGGRVQAGWQPSHSSGSTGEPFTVYHDRHAWAVLKYLVKLRTRLLAGVRPGDRVAVLDAFPPEDEGRKLAERLGRLRRVSVLQPAAAVAERLRGFAPRAVYGLPSALEEAARVGGGLRVPLVFTGGELLTPTARRVLAEAYDGRVIDVYGTSETKEIAWECAAGRAHVNADVLHVEVLDAEGRPVPAGVVGDLAVTVLVGEAMPLLRYRVGDRGLLDPAPCPCGLALPVLGRVDGRAADVLTLAGARVSPYVLTTALERVPGLVRYQISQLGPAHLRVRALPDARADRAGLPARLSRALATELPSGLDAVRVDVELVEGFRAGPRAKFRVVEPLA